MFLEFKREVERVLRDALEKASLNFEGLDLDLEESGYADISSRVAFSLARMCHRPPAIIAADIVSHIVIPAENTFIADAVAVGPYINFAVNDFLLYKTLQVIRGGVEQPGQKRGKIIIEHTSANPDGPLHIGHLRNAVIGDVLVRVLQRAGYEVETHYYVNDMGRQIALAVWGAERMAYDDTKKADHAVAEVYIAANRMIEQNSEFLKDIEELMRKYEAGDEAVIRKYETVVKKCLSGIQASLEQLQIRHDLIVWESEFVRTGAVKEVIEELKQKGDIKLDGSALILQLEGIEKALVIQRTDGTSLYTTRDLAYHRWKATRGDRLIDVFGKDHELVSQQLVKALEILGVRVPEFVIFEFVSLPTGSLSTRAGRYVSVDELIEKIEERAYQEVDRKRDDLTEDKKHEIARKVGIGALRYDMVKVSPDKHIMFDFEEALDIEKKGAPFIQYSHARACSILRAAEERGYLVSPNRACEKAPPVNPFRVFGDVVGGAHDAGARTEPVMGQSPTGDYDPNLLRERSERELIKKLSKLDSVIEEAASELKPHLIAKYARELAESFNLFYKECPVLNADEELRKARLVLVDAARIVLSAVLDILGIEAPSEM